MKITTHKTRIYKEHERIIPFILEHILSLEEKSVIVITSKIIALAEGRTRVIENENTKESLIREESSFVLRTPYTWLTIKDGMVMAAAGIDESNADNKLILLPKDSFESAATIRDELMKRFELKELGVLITDSRLFPLRAGVVGVALGYAGFQGIRDYRGMPDIFGRLLKLSQTDVADSLATAAVLCMGEGKEQQPLAVITDVSVVFTEKVNKKELYIDPKEDIYGPLFKALLG
jgi:coenzyme F420-0:L-glutamate ligase